MWTQFFIKVFVFVFISPTTSLLIQSNESSFQYHLLSDKTFFCIFSSPFIYYFRIQSMCSAVYLAFAQGFIYRVSKLIISWCECNCVCSCVSQSNTKAPVKHFNYSGIVCLLFRSAVIIPLKDQKYLVESGIIDFEVKYMLLPAIEENNFRNSAWNIKRKVQGGKQ